MEEKFVTILTNRTKTKKQALRHLAGRGLLVWAVLFSISSFTKAAPGDWPGTGTNAGVTWMNYTLANGSVISDPSDVNPAENDIFFCAQDSSSVKIASDGTNAFFRIQLITNPAGGPGGFKNSCTYLVQLADASGTWKVSIGLDAKQNNDYVYVVTTAGVETPIYYYNTEGTTAMRTIVVPGQATNYYLDFQAPIAQIANIWAGFTSATQMKIFYGTSSTNVSINKDWMTGSVVDFSLVATTKFDNIAAGSLYFPVISGNAGSVNGAVLSYTDGSAKTATADAVGDYSFTVSNNWTGTVTPSKAGYTFSPLNKSYSSITTDQSGQNFSVSSLLISGNAGTAGATLSYSDGGAKTATADALGDYSFWVSYNWSGTVTPSKTGYLFTQSSITYTNITSPQTAQNYAAAVAPVISGNTGTGGVTLSYTDGSAKTATSDAGGAYSFSVSNNWTGTVAPSKTGYSFSPVNYSYNNIAADQSNQDFSVSGLLISGNTQTSGATLSYNDGGAKTANSDGSGNYSFYVSNNWSGTVTPSKTGYAFTPANYSFVNISTPQSGKDYTVSATLISGNAGTAGATLSYTDGTAKTATADAFGDYSFWVSYNWSGAVIPSKTGYIFNPDDITLNNIITPQSGQNFTALVAPVISGNTTAGNVTLSYTDGILKTATSDGSGDYSFSVSNNWSGIVTPTKTGYVFSPLNKSYVTVAADQPGQNFTIESVLISGNVSAEGVTITYNDGGIKTTTSDVGGNFSIWVPYNWSGTLTPSKTGYAFSPSNIAIVNITAPLSNKDFSVAAIAVSGNTVTGNVTLSYTDGIAKTATSDADGNYSFTVTNNWTGNVVPSKTGFTFSPVSNNYIGITAPQTGQDFSPATVTISGNTETGGVTLSYADGIAKTSVSDINGDFSFTVSYQWTGTVTPSKTGYTFSPVNISFAAITVPQANQNFNVAKIMISGNTTKPGVTLSYNDGGAKTSTSDASGDYSFFVSKNWTGSVTPSKTGYTFSPANKNYDNISIPQTAQNYLVSTLLISGTTGIAGTVLSYNNGGAQQVAADLTGAYAIWIPYNWSGTVTPSKPGFTFFPLSGTYTNITTTETTENYSISSVEISGNTGIAGVTISYHDGGDNTAASDADGNYSIFVAAGWTGTVTASKTGYQFNPAPRTFNNLTLNTANQNFSVSAVLVSGNTALGGVTLSYHDITDKTVTSNGAGDYSFYAPVNWSGSLTPSKTGYTFLPANISFVNITVPQPANNYTCSTLKISGNTGAGNVTLAFHDVTDKSVTSDAHGDYSLWVSYNWSGVVVPSKLGYIFVPVNLTFANQTATISGQDFTATLVQGIQLVNPVNPSDSALHLVSGSVNRIQWNSVNILTARLDYSTNNGGMWTMIDDNIPSPDGQCSYLWSTPGGLPPQLQIKISKSSNPAYFSIQTSQLVDFRIVSPNGGEQFSLNSERGISWLTKGIVPAGGADPLTVCLQYTTDGGATWINISDRYVCVEGLNSMTWTTPGVAANLCKIRIIQTNYIDPDHPQIYSDESDSFFTLYQNNGLGAYYVITSPNNGEKLKSGVYQYIEWKRVGGVIQGSIQLDYSSNGGVSWNRINTAPIAGVMRYSWLVPNLNSNRCLVRMTNYLTHAQYDVCDKEFTIFASSANSSNYPNPFNPSTKISFSVDKADNVALTVYNSIGQVVRELVNNRLEPGYYEFEFNASALASGIYFYELKRGATMELHKMILLK
jgi:hypothetical protein